MLDQSAIWTAEDLATTWANRRNHLRRTDPVDRAEAEAAIRHLYEVLEIKLPPILWHDQRGSYMFDGHLKYRTLPIKEESVPISHLGQSIFFALLHKFPRHQQNHIFRMTGHDLATHSSPLAANKQIIFGHFSARRGQNNPRAYVRPSWTRHLDNLICQFDSGIVALYEFAQLMGKQIDHALQTLCEAVKRVVDTSFGVLLFNDLCVAFDRPKAMILNPANVLSARKEAAFIHRDDSAYYVINGHTLLNEDVRRCTISLTRGNSRWHSEFIRQLTLVSDKHRVHMIAYFSWEWFLASALADSKINGHRMNVLRFDRHKRWGTLYRVDWNNYSFMLLEVTNRTPNPGTECKFTKYVLPVDAMLRPLPNPRIPGSTFGASQDFTALNAVASTFGMTGAEYEAILGDES